VSPSSTSVIIGYADVSDWNRTRDRANSNREVMLELLDVILERARISFVVEECEGFLVVYDL
jgi:hypothetical protein